MASIVVAGDTSGAITVAAPAVAGTNTITLPAATGTMLTTASTTGVNASAISTGTLAQAYGGTGTTTGYYSFKNRIINGAMVIDQRNAGASVTVNTGIQNFSVDRWWGQGTASAGVFTMQRSTVAPAGFTNSLLVTVTTADSSLAANDLYDICQFIEGFNVSDFGLGTASAKTFTLSFWVRSSVTGTFGGAFGNNASNRGYPFTYSISSANTWEYKTVTVAGDTTGTWTTDNTIGLRVYFGLGAGSTFSGTAGAWGGSLFLTATGATNLMATLNATFYITGVQLEVGSTATSFDYRPYGTELALCQRYYEEAVGGFYLGNAAQTYYGTSVQFKQTKRASPTVTFISNVVGATNVSGNPYAEAVNTQGFRSMALAASAANTNWQALYKAEIEL